MCTVFMNVERHYWNASLFCHAPIFIMRRYIYNILVAHNKKIPNVWVHNSSEKCNSQFQPKIAIRLNRKLKTRVANPQKTD